MISLIFPTYNEEGNLAELHRQLREATASIEGQLFEFIFVDDCSSDRTPEILRQLHEQDERVKIIRFARNCGSHAAISAGLNECRGAGAVVLAADLQDPPEIIGQHFFIPLQLSSSRITSCATSSWTSFKTSLSFSGTVTQDCSKK